jgi:hypothetical protein
MKRVWVIGCLLVCLVCGCARTVSDKNQGLLLDLVITLRGPADLSRFRYFIVMSFSQNPLVPPVSEYFPTPGSLFNSDNTLLKAKTGGLQYYYQNYFSTWSDYIVMCQKNGVNTGQLFSSGAINFDPNTTLNTTYTPVTAFTPRLLEVSGNQVHLQFSLSYLQTGTRINYNLVTSEVTDGTESGAVWDFIENATPTVLLSPASSTPFTDLSGEFSSVPAGADILSYQVTIL